MRYNLCYATLYKFWDSLRRDLNGCLPDGILMITTVFICAEELTLAEHDILKIAMHRMIPFSVYAYFTDVEVLTCVHRNTGAHYHLHLLSMGSSYRRGF